MIFTEIRFALLLVTCWAAFFAVPARARSVVLTVWGLAFYAVYAREALPLMLVLIAATYWSSTGPAQGGVAGRGRLATLTIAAIVALFVAFKLGINPMALLPPLGGASPSTAFIIPLGFSFLAFELLHVLIERRRGRIAGLSLVDLSAFALFFPCRVAGPIKRYPAFVDAVAAARPSVDNVYAGFVRVLIGLVKKVVVADVLALTMAEMEYAATFVHVWKIFVVYGVQVLLDFSAYSDLAIGTSRMLGISVPENFDWPYFSVSIQEFWTRWHMTLSSWARDYIFTPSGRALFTTRLRRTPAAIAALSYLLTFLVIGAWHGMTPSFLVWGAYHGVLLSGYHLYRTRIPAAMAASAWFQSRGASVAGAGLTFVLVTIGWVPFTNDLPRSAALLRLMFGL